MELNYIYEICWNTDDAGGYSAGWGCPQTGQKEEPSEPGV